MNRMLQKQKDRAAMQKVLGKEDAEKPKPRTIRDRINDLQHKQYIKGAQIFATQYTTMHKCAETNNLSGLGHFLRTGDVDARDRWGLQVVWALALSRRSSSKSRRWGKVASSWAVRRAVAALRRAQLHLRVHGSVHERRRGRLREVLRDVRAAHAPVERAGVLRGGRRLVRAVVREQMDQTRDQLRRRVFRRAAQLLGHLQARLRQRAVQSRVHLLLARLLDCGVRRKMRSVGGEWSGLGSRQATRVARQIFEIFGSPRTTRAMTRRESGCDEYLARTARG